MRNYVEDSPMQYTLRLATYALPIVQVFGARSVDSSIEIITFADQIWFATGAVAIISYLVVIALRHSLGFRFNLLPRRRQNYYTYLSRTDEKSFSKDEIKAYKLEHDCPRSPVVITDRNIWVFTVPLMVLSLGAFLWIGTHYRQPVPAALQTLQAISYALFMISAIFQIALPYSRQTLIKQDAFARRNRLNKIRRLLMDGNAVANIYSMEIISMNEINRSDLIKVLHTEVKINDQPYTVISDLYADWIESVNPIP